MLLVKRHSSHGILRYSSWTTTLEKSNQVCSNHESLPATAAFTHSANATKTKPLLHQGRPIVSIFATVSHDNGIRALRNNRCIQAHAPVSRPFRVWAIQSVKCCRQIKHLDHMGRSITVGDKGINHHLIFHFQCLPSRAIGQNWVEGCRDLDVSTCIN